VTPDQTDLVERIRTLIASAPAVREVSMFGGRAIMVNEKIIVSAQKDGGLLVRVDADHHAEHLRRPGAAQAEMGAGRDMGPGWIDVDADALRDDEQLQSWIRIALDRNRTVTGGCRIPSSP
jgi:TfoX/Sxy family transcriptional regulator of competence genes